MIPNYLALIPLQEGRRAALRAVGEVEHLLLQGKRLPEYAWARAFFRHLTGSKRIGLKEINYFAFTLTDRELRGRKAHWISAIDTLIESRGTCCYLPLSVSAAYELFPETRFKEDERFRQKLDLREQKYSRQRSKARLSEQQAYQSRVGQAEIDLAFQTPATVQSWFSRWRQTDISENLLDDMFFRWSERFPSLTTLERWHWDNQPHWALMYEVQALATEAPAQIKEFERWMVPNKLIHQVQGDAA
ncbi:MAG TPA: plasmid SOS inhibition protein A [Buttiauxella sp.]|jgi:hypothetical protein